jgi:hypothetical protein
VTALLHAFVSVLAETLVQPFKTGACVSLIATVKLQEP